MLGWMKDKLESGLLREISITSDMQQMISHLWQKAERPASYRPLDVKKGKKGSEKAGLKCNIQKTNIMTSGPITSWQIDGETVETVADFIWKGSKITADGDCSHEIKRRLLLGRKVMTYLDHILKSIDITLPTKVRLVTSSMDVRVGL